MARLLIGQGKEEQGEAVLLGMVSDYPRYTPAYSELARLWVRHGRVAEAEEMLEKAMDRVEGDPVLYNNAGICALLQDDLDGALANFSKAAAAAPGNPKYRANQALALGLLGRTDDARNLYMQILPKDDVEHNMETIAALRTGTSEYYRDPVSLGDVREPDAPPVESPAPEDDAALATPDPMPMAVETTVTPAVAEAEPVPYEDVDPAPAPEQPATEPAPADSPEPAPQGYGENPKPIITSPMIKLSDAPAQTYGAHDEGQESNVDAAVIYDAGETEEDRDLQWRTPARSRRSR
jgi:hypothetical protein